MTKRSPSVRDRNVQGCWPAGQGCGAAEQSRRAARDRELRGRSKIVRRILGHQRPRHCCCSRRAEPTRDECRGLIRDAAIGSRTHFLRAHTDAVYDKLTTDARAFVRVEELADGGAKEFPGTRSLAARSNSRPERDSLQRAKAGLEIDQGLFVSAVLRSQRAGTHLCHAMLLPLAKAQELLPKFKADGVVELPGGSIERRTGKGGDPHSYQESALPQRRGSDLALPGSETCVDLALLDPSDRGSWCAARRRRSSIRNMQARRCIRRRHQPDAPSTTAASRSCGTSSRDLGYAWSISSIAGWLVPTMRRPTSSGGRPSRNPGSRRWRVSPLAATVRSCSRSTTCWPRRQRSRRCRRARRALFRAPPTCGCRERSATASPARRSSTSGGSNATAPRAG